MAETDYLALARIGIEHPDRRPDLTGLDDGPPLPRATINGAKRELAMAMRQSGATLRSAAAELGVSHETVRDWTRGVRRHHAQLQK